MKRDASKGRSPFYDSALKLMKARSPNEKKALDLLRRAHDDGDVRASYAIGTWHLYGKGGLGKSPKRAVPFLEIASAAKLPQALFDLAVCCERGEGIRRDTKRAAKLYLAAALRGDSQSIFEVGRCYYAGIGFRKDRKMADVYFSRAEELGVYEGDDK